MGALSSPWLKWQEQGALSMTLLFYPRQGFVGRFALQTPFGNFAPHLGHSAELLVTPTAAIEVRRPLAAIRRLGQQMST